MRTSPCKNVPDLHSIRQGCAFKLSIDEPLPHLFLAGPIDCSHEVFQLVKRYAPDESRFAAKLGNPFCDARHHDAGGTLWRLRNLERLQRRRHIHTPVGRLHFSSGFSWPLRRRQCHVARLVEAQIPQAPDRNFWLDRVTK